MPVRLSDEQCIVLPVGNEDIRAYFPPADDPEMVRAVRKLFADRGTTGRGGNALVKMFDARIRFFDSQCSRVENAEAKNETGEYVPLCDLADWKEKFPSQYKVSIALQFEEQATLTGDEVKN